MTNQQIKEVFRVIRSGLLDEEAVGEILEWLDEEAEHLELEDVEFEGDKAA